MRREQLEKISAALVALVDAIPDAKNVSVTCSQQRSPRIAIHVETDSAVQALAGASELRVEISTQDDPQTPRWWLGAAGSFPLGGTYVMIIGPTHFESTRPTEDAKVDAAVAQAEDASRGAP